VRGFNVTVFKISKDGTFSVVHEFDASVDGPATGLAQASDGNFYGVAGRTAFRMTPDGAITPLHTFLETSTSPFGTRLSSLIQARDGHLYGTTFSDRAGGSVFRMTVEGEVTYLHSFGPFDYPVDAVTEGLDGNLYGVTTSFDPMTAA